VKHDDHDAKEALRRVGLFARLDDKKLGRIAAQTKTYKFGPGDSVIDADSSGRFGRLYTVVDGTAEARVEGRTVASFGPGDYFGEMSVLDGSPRSASIVATSDLETFGLSAWNMRSLLREEPEIALHIIETLAARLRAKNTD
jgi:CRP/FNR family transcriptional regulator, cyclic AMP receptor protein